MVKVLISRQIKEDMEAKVHDSLVEYRVAAMRQPGYISGETLINTSNPQEILVISTWHSLEHWKAWEGSKQRAALAKLLGPLIAEEQVTSYYIAAREA